MIKTTVSAVVAAGLLAILSIHQSYAQSYGYPDSNPVGGVTNATLAKCVQLKIERSQCSDSSVLLKERILLAQESITKGSGTPMLATQGGQLALFIGVLGAIFGAVAAAFFVSGKRTKGQPAR